MIKKYLPVLTVILLFSCQNQPKNITETPADTVGTETKPVILPEPFATKSVSKFCNVIGWSDSIMPKAPEGFVVTKFASGLNNPRWIYQAPNGDIFVSQASSDPGAVKKLEAQVSGKAKSQNLVTAPIR